jgi:hypothetical protein
MLESFEKYLHVWNLLTNNFTLRPVEKYLHFGTCWKIPSCWNLLKNTFMLEPVEKYLHVGTC